MNSEKQTWELKGHSYQLADTGDYDGYYEITDGKISLLTKDDDDEALQPIVDALNNSGCKFYIDDWYEIQYSLITQELENLKSLLKDKEIEFLNEYRNGRIVTIEEAERSAKQQSEKEIELYEALERAYNDFSGEKWTEETYKLIEQTLEKHKTNK